MLDIIINPPSDSTLKQFEELQLFMKINSKLYLKIQTSFDIQLYATVHRSNDMKASYYHLFL